METMMQRIVEITDVIRLNLMANWISLERRLFINAWRVVWVTTHKSSDTIKMPRSKLRDIVKILNFDAFSFFNRYIPNLLYAYQIHL